MLSKLTAMKNKDPQKPKFVFGLRSGKNVLEGKVIRKHDDGTDVFDDYWTDSDNDESSELSQIPSIPSISKTSINPKKHIPLQHTNGDSSLLNKTRVISRRDKTLLINVSYDKDVKRSPAKGQNLPESSQQNIHHYSTRSVTKSFLSSSSILDANYAESTRLPQHTLSNVKTTTGIKNVVSPNGKMRKTLSTSKSVNVDNEHNESSSISQDSLSKMDSQNTDFSLSKTNKEKEKTVMKENVQNTSLDSSAICMLSRRKLSQNEAESVSGSETEPEDYPFIVRTSVVMQNSDQAPDVLNVGVEHRKVKKIRKSSDNLRLGEKHDECDAELLQFINGWKESENLSNHNSCPVEKDKTGTIKRKISANSKQTDNKLQTKVKFTHANNSQKLNGTRSGNELHTTDLPENSEYKDKINTDVIDKNILSKKHSRELSNIENELESNSLQTKQTRNESQLQSKVVSNFLQHLTRSSEDNNIIEQVVMQNGDQAPDVINVGVEDRKVKQIRKSSDNLRLGEKHDECDAELLQFVNGWKESENLSNHNSYPVEKDKIGTIKRKISANSKQTDNKLQTKVKFTHANNSQKLNSTRSGNEIHTTDLPENSEYIDEINTDVIDKNILSKKHSRELSNIENELESNSLQTKQTINESQLQSKVVSNFPQHLTRSSEENNIIEQVTTDTSLFGKNNGINKLPIKRKSTLTSLTTAKKGYGIKQNVTNKRKKKTNENYERISDSDNKHQKKKKVIAVNLEKDDPVSLRRSTRQKFPPLAHWRHERLIYRIDEDGTINCLGIDPGLKEEDAAKKALLLPKNSSKNKFKIPRKNVKLHDPVKGIKLNVPLKNLVKRFDHITWDKNEEWPFRVKKNFETNNSSFGFVEIKQNEEKPLQYLPNEDIYFCLIQGTVKAVLHEHEIMLKKKDTLMVPKGIPYGLRNIGLKKALLIFCVGDFSYLENI